MHKLEIDPLQTFKTLIPIKSFYPPMSVDVKLQLTDADTGMDLVCQYIRTRLV